MSSRRTAGVIAIANNKTTKDHVDLDFLGEMADADKVAMLDKLITGAERVRAAIKARQEAVVKS